MRDRTIRTTEQTLQADERTRRAVRPLLFRHTLREHDRWLLKCERYPQRVNRMFRCPVNPALHVVCDADLHYAIDNEIKRLGYSRPIGCSIARQHNAATL